jgi:hypothetical protein
MRDMKFSYPVRFPVSELGASARLNTCVSCIEKCEAGFYAASTSSRDSCPFKHVRFMH